MKKDRLYDILETMKKNPLQAVLSHFGALSDHSAMGGWVDILTSHLEGGSVGMLGPAVLVGCVGR